ncbi:MAG: Ig-like domain-containing protein [Lachnospiraceae bacterium]|nr:Ig-like domain-containing protein [Lachnospiraceae bacterium]
MFKRMGVMILAFALCLTPVNYGQAAKKASISKKKITLKVGKTKKLKVKNVKKVTWKTSNKKVATVNKKGLVKAVKAGKATITAKTNKGKFKCKVTVKKASSSSATTTPSSPSPSTTAAPVESASPIPSASPLVVPTLSPDVPRDEDGNPLPEVIWPEGMKSGLNDDYKTYFRNAVDTTIKKTADEDVNMQDVTYHSDVLGVDRQTYVYLPPNYDETKEYPVMYMFHGLGATSNQWPSSKVGNIFNTLINRDEVEPFVAVMPAIVPTSGVVEYMYAPETIQAFYDFPEVFEKDLEPFILENYAVSKDPKNTAICGLSMGGYETLTIAFKTYPSHFNYIGAFSPAWDGDLKALNIRNWDFHPRVVLLCTGSEDEVVYDWPLNYSNTLTENKVEHMWYIHPGEAHTGPVWTNAAYNFVKYSFGKETTE